MGQSCKICTHADARAIDAALLANRDGLRIIGAQYRVSKDSLSRHFRAHLEPRQAAEPGQDVLPPEVSAPQSTTPHYDAFIQRFRGRPPISLTEVRGWGYPPDVLEAFIDVALVRGDLSRRSEPRQ